MSQHRDEACARTAPSVLVVRACEPPSLSPRISELAKPPLSLAATSGAPFLGAPSVTVIGVGSAGGCYNAGGSWERVSCSTSRSRGADDSALLFSNDGVLGFGHGRARARWPAAYRSRDPSSATSAATSLTANSIFPL